MKISREKDRLAAPVLVIGLALLLLTAAFLALPTVALAQEDVNQTGPASPLHPNIALLDGTGENVLDSGQPVSTMTTCGACHDTEFIVEHSFHADVGLRTFTDPGEVPGGREWDTSSGLFGKWSPLLYRYLSPAGDARIDLTTPEWLQLFGARHVGGGPAVFSRSGQSLTDLDASTGSPETSLVDPDTGDLRPWDWSASGTVEMNCFLCHTPDPNNTARTSALQSGDFAWSATATLVGTGAVVREGDSWNWNQAAFDEQGEINLAVQDPGNTNCGQCHGLVHVDSETPLSATGCEPEQWSTITTGQINSPQRLSDSGINLMDKENLSRSWDIHAERVIGCTDCHYSLNNPVYFQESDDSRPDHLLFDPRRIDLGEYLYRPLHQFAKGQSAQGALAPELDNTLRRCESCHSVEATHDWLPYKERHTSVMSCETCHVPKLYAPARQYIDWTVLQEDGSPQSGCRGIDPSSETTAPDSSTTALGGELITGYQPVLLSRQNADGSRSLAPYNLITSWYWIYGDPARPVPLRDLEAAWLSDGAYPPAIVAAFDADDNGRLEARELVIDSEEKEAVIASRLAALGLDEPRISGEIQPYSINHDVTTGDWATKECQECHGDDSRVLSSMVLADRTPGGVIPEFVAGGSTYLGGDITAADNGLLTYQPNSSDYDLYILGHSSVSLIDRLGAVLFLGTVFGASFHGGLRAFRTRRRQTNAPAELREEYMYGIYERLWHWLQTAAILLLLFTGLIIHKPDIFGALSFKYVVQVHNILAAILVINAALALFYHLASGEIRQYLPRPHGFFDQAVEQALFYLRGIFRGDLHPFEKTRRRKLNPLQQITYFSILNVLLPLQVLTGLFMWGMQRWPEAAAQLGGLPFLAPFHTLISWLFASFIVMHVYLTTTGHSPVANIKAMMMGWDEVEIQPNTAAPIEEAV